MPRKAMKGAGGKFNKDDSLLAKKMSNTTDGKKSRNVRKKIVHFVTLENLNKKTKRAALFKHLYTVLLPNEIKELYLRGDEGFMKLTTKEAFEKALKLDKTELDGKKIRVKDPFNEENESEEERAFDGPPSKKNNTNEEEIITLYENHCSDSDDEKINTNDTQNSKNQRTPPEIRGEINVNGESQLDKKCALFIGNSYYSITENQIRTFIESIAAPEDVNRFFQPKNKSRGFAFVELSTEETLERILKLDGSKIMRQNARIGGDHPENLQDPDITEGSERCEPMDQPTGFNTRFTPSPIAGPSGVLSVPLKQETTDWITQPL